ncbi:MAG: hypothetical protein IJU87_07270 [Lachnospiraceae bacterium]|nr:hypothetical protein [Lachnospiraceae bacterium]
MNNTGKMLKTLFDYQRFEEESSLQGVINETINKSKNMRILSDDELENAAGGVEENVTVVHAYCPYCSEDPETGKKEKRMIELYSGGRGLCHSCFRMIEGL